ncbi:FAD-dependent oxidoreductase [Candidatus Gracilibacteria bacterium]|nr:FAD-dependent oxidoreductase [Candidatus Gracilibacteria bacterium]
MKITKLVAKKVLTHDVFELVYESELDMSNIVSGQFITFLLPEIGGRAYSIANIADDKVILLVKRVSEENSGRGGSIMLCDAEIGTEFKSVGPVGKFVLQDTTQSKCFLGTGTGLAPLYHQVLRSVERGCELKMIFGVRKYEDVFYEQELLELKETYSNFDFTIYLSRETEIKADHFKSGYVTEFLNSDSVKDYGEYYLCGAPVVVESCEQKLSDLGVSQESIFEEKY